MKLIIVRHGESLSNTQMLFEGFNPGELTEKGKEQARKVGLRLKEEEIDFAYVSDLKRAQDTAAEILKFHKNLPVVVTAELRETNYGILEGAKKEVYLEAFKKSGKEKFYDFTPEGGERSIDSLNRVRNFYESILQKHRGKIVLLVGHGTVLRFLLASFFGKSIHESEGYRLANTSVTMLEVTDDNSHKVYFLNSTEHLG